ncbi:DNA-binding response regulator [Marinobacterium zhoushanense]|uniref:DNA-binding response regulator n=1 Tax=Marinobacterium zhoushanense TaxID=1679163 RepID=A0ABQ1K9T2_9GAMM|nr:response regulator transcription factor [Marinobacterium zhoushanense]GGB92197.1 DNA-binding response regulator [Marinobacterium zhoushanense]
MDRILLLEDYEESRVLLQIALQRAFGSVTVDCAASLGEARQLLKQSTYGLAILDLNLPDGCGIEILELITREHDSTICIIATIADDDESLLDSLRNGAKGYLLKTESPVELAGHLQGLLEGQLPLSPRMASRVINYFNTNGSRKKPLEAHLTEREKEVLTLIAKGASRKAIARALDISINTTNDHIKSIYRKLKVTSRVEATRIAIDHGLSD